MAEFFHVVEAVDITHRKTCFAPMLLVERHSPGTRDLFEESTLLQRAYLVRRHFVHAVEVFRRRRILLIGALSRSTASKAAGLEYRRRYCRPDDSYGGRDTEQRFSVLIKNAFENRFIVAERLPVGDQPLVLQQRIISAEHDTVLQPIADLALQGVRIVTWATIRASPPTHSACAA